MMRPMNLQATFLKSGKAAKDYPFPYKPEIAMVGRSNAGKSSFINALVKQKVARVSATPGKTRLLQFFAVSDLFYLVDMPGYGFAKGNRQEVASWRNMIEEYLRERQSLKGVLLIMDVRRDWQPEEAMLKEWFEHHKTPWAVILNKCDKLSRSQIQAKVKALKSPLGEVVEVFPVSSKKKSGVDEIQLKILKEWCA